MISKMKLRILKAFFLLALSVSLLLGAVVNVSAAEPTDELGIEIDKKKIVLDSDIKAFGTFTVPVKLYAGISAQLKVTVTE